MRQKWEIFRPLWKPPLLCSTQLTRLRTQSVLFIFLACLVSFIFRKIVGVEILSSSLCLKGWIHDCFCCFCKPGKRKNLHLLLGCRRPRQLWSRHLSSAWELLLQMGFQAQNTEWGDNCLSIICLAWHADQVQQLVFDRNLFLFHNIQLWPRDFFQNKHYFILPLA